MEWFYGQGSQDIGPLTTDEVFDLVLSGQILSDTPMWREGLENWTTYAAVEHDFPPRPDWLPEGVAPDPLASTDPSPPRALPDPSHPASDPDNPYATPQTELEDYVENEIPNPQPWFIASIVLTVLMVFGCTMLAALTIPGIVYASNAKRKLDYGFVDMAIADTRKAKNWTTFGGGAALALWVLFIFIAILLEL